MNIISKCCNLAFKILDGLKDVASLIGRLWIGHIFYNSGLSKIQSWGATIVLFKYDYSVPLLDPVTAAYIGTAAEFILPALLVLGLGTRLSTAAFFVYNFICVISFSFLWTNAGIAGLHDHINWGIILLLLMTYGSGRISVDFLICRFTRKY
jgi:putative oxidoreductase